MNKLEKMSLSQLLVEMKLCIGVPSIFDIWSSDEDQTVVRKTKSNPEGRLAVDLLQDIQFLKELMRDEHKLIRFLFEHEKEIDKVRYVAVNLMNYEKNIEKARDSETRKQFEQEAAKARKLLKGIKKLYVQEVIDEGTGKMSELVIIDTAALAEDRQRKKREENISRLEEIEKEEHLGNILQSISLNDLEQVIASNNTVGNELRLMIEYNSLIDANNGNVDYVSNLLRTDSFESEVKKSDPSIFINEMILRYREYLEEINIDKMLLCSGIRYIEAMEMDNINPEEAEEVYRRLQTIKKHTDKKVKVIMQPEGGGQKSYGLKELETEMKRFIKVGDHIEYIKEKDCEKIHEDLLEGAKSFNELSLQMVDALQLNERQISEILKKYPENYGWFLKHDKCTHSKKAIIKAIKNVGQCSLELLKTLCENTDITSDEIQELFDDEIITVNALKVVTNTHGQIITKEQIFDKYKEYQESKEENENADNLESKKIQLERYALAYKNIEFTENTPEEKQQKSDEFMDELGDKVDTSDLVPLYSLDLLTLKTVVDWGGESTIEQLVENESLKPSDARCLRDEGLLDENVLENLFKNSEEMSYAYQVALVYAVFDGQTQEEKEIRDRLAQYYHIENAITHSSANNNKHKKTKQSELTEEEYEEPKEEIRMRDPGAKYNLLASFDKDVKIEEGIVDGHIIFHYPNIGEGTVLIEKLHRITSNKQTRQIEIKPDNQSATYVMSEEEFIKMRSQLIEDGKVDRTKLTQKWWITRDPEHWIPHAGTSAWEMALKERFSINKQHSRYSPEELAKIDDLIEKSIESKRGEDR